MRHRIVRLCLALSIVAFSVPALVGVAAAESPIDPIYGKISSKLSSSWSGVQAAVKDAKAAKTRKGQAIAAKAVYEKLGAYQEALEAAAKTKGVDAKKFKVTIDGVKALRAAGYVTKDGIGSKLSLSEEGLVRSWTGFDGPLVSLAPESMTLTR